MLYGGLNCDNIVFEGQVESSKRLNLLYDDVSQHYHVITNLTGAMAKRYDCRACNKGYRSDVTHSCDQTCSDCMASPPCVYAGVRTPCEDCNRHFKSRMCFDNHKKQSGGGKKGYVNILGVLWVLVVLSRFLHVVCSADV